MSGDPAARIRIIWSLEARADLRGIDREKAVGILHLRTRSGDVKKLKLPFTGFRLRCGDYRVFFDQEDENTISVTTVRHRSEAHR